MKKDHYYIPEEKPIILHDIAIYPNSLEACRGENKIKLRKKEFELLQFLAKNSNKVINKNALLEYVWNYDLQSNTKTLEVHMSNLRRKIDSQHKKKLIETIHGTGYKFSDLTANEDSNPNQLKLF